MFSSVHVVTQKQEISWGQQRAHAPESLLKTHKISEITMNVACK